MSINRINVIASAEKVIQLVSDGDIPQRIFCYQRFDPNEHTLDILRNKELYFAHRDLLNDPFEFKVYPSIAPPGHIVEHASDGCFNDNFTREDLQMNLTEEDALKFICQATDIVMKDKGIKCFTTSPDNLLMWAHYADAHSGLCFEFDVLECPEFFSYPVVVQYSLDYPIIDFSKKN